MKYFEKYLQNSKYDVKILVCSDIPIFEWILKYAHISHSNKTNGLSEKYPEISIRKLAAVLSSAEYLKMDRLAQKCIEFTALNIEEVSALPIAL